MIQTDAVGSTIRFLPLIAAYMSNTASPTDYALKAITIVPAEILGVADRVVSIEPRKDADLRMLSGYPLDVMTKVQKAFINGELVYPR